jgi:AcrR family transcriptional regulator
MAHTDVLKARVDERAEQILAAAGRAIVRRGFADTRIRDVAREAGTSTGTVHYYFETKDEVLVAALGWANERAYQVIDEALAAGGPATERLGRVIQLSVPYPGILRDWWLLWIELWSLVARRPELHATGERVSQRWRAYYIDLVREGAESGEFRGASDPLQIAERIVALVDGLAFQVVVGYQWLPPERMRDLALAFAAEELGAELDRLERAALATLLP